MPVYIADTAVGLNFQVALGGRMVDLFDALRTYKCPPSTITAAIFAMQGKIVQYREAATAAGLAGKTMTLGGISRLG